MSHSADRADRSPRPRRQSWLIAWLSWWIVGVAFWLVLEDTVDRAELIAGLITAALAATAAVLARDPETRPRARGRWLAHLGRLPLAMITDLPVLAAALARAIVSRERDPGRLRTFSFEPETDPDRYAAQIAVAALAGSVAPGSIVVGFDAERGVMLVHQLDVRDGRRAADPLELG